jgi:23S rRNA pseudouridine1911/1915/1917 synthase
MNNISELKNHLIYEDNHLLVFNKQPGLLVQGDKTGDLSLLDILKNYLKITKKKEGNVYLGLVHRLDRTSSGVMVFAKTSKALSRLNKQFKSREVLKTYWAVVEGKNIPNKEELVNWVKKNQKKNKSFVFNKKIEGCKKAILAYKLIKTLNNYSFIQVELKSGRHHQIRCQIAYRGYPIKGDIKYGSKRSNKNSCIYLHSRDLVIYHPVTQKKLKFTARCPKDSLWESCEEVGF